MHQSGSVQHDRVNVFEATKWRFLAKI